MKILLANKFFYLKGGSETVFFQERSGLEERGLTVVDFSMQDPRNLPSDFEEDFVPNINYHPAKGGLGRLKTAFSLIHSGEAVTRLSALVTREAPQIAHLHNIYHQLTPSIIRLLKEYGVKVVLTLHDGKLLCPAYVMLNRGEICVECEGRQFYKAATTRCQGSMLRGMLLAAEAYWQKWRKSYEQVDLFLAPSRFMADLVSTFRVPVDKIRIVRNGIDTNAFEWGETDEGYVLFFGRVLREKGVETLLRARAGMKARPPLKIAGTGPLAEELRSRYPDVEFLGHLAGQELRSAVGKASFVVVPSELYENSPMTILEAMAAARPVIGSRIGGIPEQIEDGVTGFLFEMGNASDLAAKMKILWEDPDLRRSMGIAARRKLEQEYSLNSHMSALMKIFEDVLKG